MTATRIDLGLAPEARLGRLELLPPVRMIRRDDGAEEVIEPRVMQVLLALTEARGTIVRREELTERCWDGRIVGEDAINRVLSRLRRVADGIGVGSFKIETVTRIGYRLVELVERPVPDAAPPLRATPSHGEPPVSPRHTRRTALIGAAAAGGLTLAGGGIWWERHRQRMPQAARDAMKRGMAAFRMLSLDQLAVAAAAFHEAAELAPDHAEPWSSLALVYRMLYSVSHGQEASLDAQRARDAAAKALRLDPDNGDAQATLATLQPEFHNWLAYDAACRPVLKRHPDGFGIGLLYIGLLADTGRIREVNALAQRLMAQDAGWPTLYTDIVLSSWCLGKLDDAETASARAIEQWPRHIGSWFVRQRFLAYSGQAAAALAMVEDADHRPVGLPQWDFDLSAAECRALLTRATVDIDAAAALYHTRSRTSVGIAGNGLQFFAAVGRPDEAIALLEALYFNRGFDVGERFFAEEQGIYSERRERPTWFFWFPFMAQLRADPRLGAILKEIGLADYWRKSGTKPDFAIAGI